MAAIWRSRVNTLLGAVVMAILGGVTGALIFWAVRGPSPGPAVQRGTVTVHYRDGATQQEANILLSYLESAKMRPDEQVRAQIRRSGNQLLIVFQAAGRDEAAAVDAIRAIGWDLQTRIFTNQELTLALGTESFRIRRIIRLSDT